MLTPLATAARILATFHDPARCWLWPGSHPGRYGHIAQGRRGRPLLAHRVVWELRHGPIPDGICVLHRCDNGYCVNPSHLFLGTQRDNIRDMLGKHRDRLVGERHHSAILTEAAVREIRRSTDTGRALAQRFGVAPTTICNVRKGRRWAHVR